MPRATCQKEMLLCIGTRCVVCIPLCDWNETAQHSMISRMIFLFFVVVKTDMFRIVQPGWRKMTRVEEDILDCVPSEAQ